jgi:hypothetical protein
MHGCEYIILPKKAQFTEDSCKSKEMNLDLLIKYTSSVYKDLREIVWFSPLLYSMPSRGFERNPEATFL